MKSKNVIQKLSFKEGGLIPVVIQDHQTLQVLTMAYMNPQALLKTIRTKQVHFWSRSRKKLWHKGATSGNFQRVREILVDCDRDALLVRVEPVGPACHTGAVSCYYRELSNGRFTRIQPSIAWANILDSIYSVILDRKVKRPKGSYVSSLFNAGRDQILKKIGEESGELIISSKNRRRSAIIWEVADLWFHTLVIMGYHGISPKEIYAELGRRFGQPGLKHKKPK